MDKDNSAVDSAGKTYPGVAVNKGDDNKVNEKLVKERTRTLDSSRGLEDSATDTDEN